MTFEYPPGFNNANSKIIPVIKGAQPTTASIIKIEGNVATLRRITSSTSNYVFELIFIKC